MFIRMYYAMRPLIPRLVRLTLRRQHARSVASRCNGSWPIQESAAKTPQGWPGWPENKQFALVLSHDVEGCGGLQNVGRLAELEMDLGFRSAFNLVPEGEYSTPKRLRDHLTKNGFEVGVHDLNHDGKLYDSRQGFQHKAARINSYLREWNASGFRSAFMLHKLDWLHELNIRYDSSTFDVDPFEPQPDGVSTIFPFWVPDNGKKNAHRNASASPPSKISSRNPRGGYLELPYTLPQDSTLFLFLQERTNAIWKRKLDWIVQNEGMAFLNVHPDYINFGDQPDKYRYPVQLYTEFLQYIKKRYHGQYWHALPREAAAYCADLQPACPVRVPKNICMIAATHYATDGRVSRYAQTLAARGDHVDVIACCSDDGPLKTTELDGVNLHEITHAQDERKRGPFSHLVLLLWFFVRATAFIRRNHRVRPYDFVHVHNIPEWLVFAAWRPKLSGAPILLDIHDLVPELFLAKFKQGGNSILGPILKAVERISCKFADHVIISNHLWKYKLLERSVPKNKCSVFINNIDMGVFYDRPRTRTDERKVILFHGSLQWHQGLDIAIRAFLRVLTPLPTAEFHIYGCGGEKNALIKLAKDLGLGEKVLFYPLVPVTEIPQIIANADLGVVPKRVDSFGNEAYSTKIMEFMSQGVPVVISRTAIDCYYFNDKQVRFCESGNVEAFAAAMVEVLTNQTVRETMIKNSHAYVALNHWGTKKQEYLDLVDGLISGPDGPLSNTAEGRSLDSLAASPASSLVNGNPVIHGEGRI